MRFLLAIDHSIESIKWQSVTRGRRSYVQGYTARSEQQRSKCTHLAALDLFNSRSRMVGTSISAPSFSNVMPAATPYERTADLLVLLLMLLCSRAGRSPSPLSPVFPYTAKRRVAMSRRPAIVERWRDMTTTAVSCAMCAALLRAGTICWISVEGFPLLLNSFHIKGFPVNVPREMKPLSPHLPVPDPGRQVHSILEDHHAWKRGFRSRRP